MAYDIITIIAIGVVIYSIINAFKSFREIRRLNKVGNDMSRYQWLIQMGMQEQAIHFNAFGLRTKNHKSFEWF